MSRKTFTVSEIDQAARKLNDILSDKYPMQGHPPRFMVGIGEDKIFVYAPKRYPEIDNSFEGIPVEYHKSDCVIEAF